MHDCDDDTAAAAAIDDCVGVIHCLISLSLSLSLSLCAESFASIFRRKGEGVEHPLQAISKTLNPKNTLKRGFEKYAQKKNRSSSDRTPPPL